MVKVPPLLVERPQPVKLYGWPGLIATCSQLPCQPAGATSLSELLPESTSAGVVSMLAWAARFQPAPPSSKPPLATRLLVGTRARSSNQKVPAAKLCGTISMDAAVGGAT